MQMTPERTLWACRRGMLELDLFLLPFYEQAYEQLSTSEKQIFSQLLTASDPDLLAYLMLHKVPENKEWIILVEKIRHVRLICQSPLRV